VFATGLSFEIPEGHVMKVFSRSGHGFKQGLRLSNGTGIIDSDYRGELMVKLHNDGVKTAYIAAGERIAQGMIVPVEQAEFVFADSLSDTERGTGGLGSTGRV
jgi:dUTP pyrophosphatase